MSETFSSRKTSLPNKKKNKSNCEIDTLIKRDNRCQPSYNDVVQFPDNRVILLHPIFIFDNSAYDMIFIIFF